MGKEVGREMGVGAAIIIKTSSLDFMIDNDNSIIQMLPLNEWMNECWTMAIVNGGCNLLFFNIFYVVFVAATAKF